VIKEGVHIGSDVMIGAGSVVLHDIPDGELAYGVPARVVRQQVPADDYATYQLGSKSLSASKRDIDALRRPA
jgi:galactoside O-acetyltransferase